MSYTSKHEIVVKHFLGNIVFKKRTENIDEEYPTDMRTSMFDLKDKIVEQKSFSKDYHKGALTITLEDASYIEEEKCIILLINAIANKEHTTVIKQKETKQRKEITPSVVKGEGYEHSAHVVIFTEPDSNSSYDILLEKAESIDTTIFKLFINKILFLISKKYEKEFTTQTSYTKEKVRLKPALEIYSKPDEQFINELRSGYISDLTLISDTPSEFVIPDTNHIVKTKEHQLKISTESIKNDPIEYFKKLGKYFSSQSNHNQTKYNKIKIKYKNPESSAGKGGGTAIFSAENFMLDAKESLVTKKYIISDFEGAIKDSYDKINSEIVRKMVIAKKGR